MSTPCVRLQVDPIRPDCCVVYSESCLLFIVTVGAFPLTLKLIRIEIEKYTRNRKEKKSQTEVSNGEKEPLQKQLLQSKTDKAKFEHPTPCCLE